MSYISVVGSQYSPSLHRQGCLLENTPLVRFIRNCIRDMSGVFSISSLVKISMTSFLVICVWVVVCLIKRILHARRYEFYVIVARIIYHSFAALICEILFLPLEHKIHVFSPPCNILYAYTVTILADADILFNDVKDVELLQSKRQR